MTTKTILAAIAGAIVAFLLGYLVFVIMLGGFYASHTVHHEGLMKNPPVMWAIFMFCLSWSLLLAIVFSKWANAASFGKGLMTGLWMSFLIILIIDFMYYAFMNLWGHKLLMMDVCVNTVLWGITGGVIGMVLGMGKKEVPLSSAH